jgi:hypothetical protein
MMKTRKTMMTPLDFIASLPHGEAKAAALTIFNLMTPVWITLDGSPDKLPPPYDLIVIRTTEGFEFLATRDAEPEKYSDWCWSKVVEPYWDTDKQCIVFDKAELEPQDWIVTHWRPIA